MNFGQVAYPEKNDFLYSNPDIIGKGFTWVQYKKKIVDGEIKTFKKLIIFKKAF